MEITKNFAVSCSEYTVVVTNVSDDAFNAIELLRKDIDDADNKCSELRAALGPEPEYTPFKDNTKWDKWYKKLEENGITKKEEKIWDDMNEKYNNMFSTTIHSWEWDGRTLFIKGYLNEDELVEWLRKQGCNVRDILDICENCRR